MKHVGMVLLLAAVAAAGPASELKELEKARDESKLGFVEKWKQFKPQFEAFVNKYPKTDEALSAKFWLLQQSWWLYKDKPAMHKEAARWADDIFENHGQSPRLGDMVLSHYVFSAEQKLSYFERLLEKSEHKSVKAAAHFGLARADKANAKAHFEALAKDYADVAYRKTTYGAMANAHLSPHDRALLKVGQQAPEIEGINHLGQPMKLSDFRGKVVVLDFWGDW